MCIEEAVQSTAFSFFSAFFLLRIQIHILCIENKNFRR